jgi:hypothetical protein
MKSIARVLLVGAVAAMAIAVSAAPSEAAKKKAKKMAACTPMMTCSTACKGVNCNHMACGIDGKWHAAIPPVCTKPFCPSAC